MKKLLLMLCCALALSGQGAFDLVKEGVSSAVIVLPADPVPAEEFAARELAGYLERVSGARLETVRGDALPEGPAIVVGNHPANAEWLAELDRRCDQYDRFLLAASGNILHIAAPHSSGLLYAAWEFLQQLGVEWLLPGAKGVYLPELPTIRVPDAVEFHQPRCEFRSSTNYIDAGMPWMVEQQGPRMMVEEMENGHNAAWMYAWRMRLNSTSFDSRDDYRILGAGHSYEVYLPISRYHAEHPEWFGLRDGRRQAPGEAWQICFNSDEAAAEFARNAMRDIEATLASGVPEERILLCVSPNDHEVFCQCQRCNAMIDAGGFYSGNVLHFANMVAGHVHAKYPGVKITYYVYHTYGRIPDQVRPAPGVYAYITAWTANNSLAVNNAKPMMDPAGNRIFAEVFDWFADNSSGVYVYPYYGHFEIFSAWPMQTQMDYDFKKMAQYPNFLGMNSESHLHWASQPLNLYLYPRLLWNPDVDQAELIRSFCRKAYGPAAEEAERFFAVQQAQMDRLGYICGNGIEVRELLPPAVIAECDAWMQRITAKLDGMDEATRWRTQLLADGWHYSKLYAEAIRLLADGNDPADQVRIKAAFDAIDEFMDTEYGRYAFEVRVAEIFNLNNYRNMVGVNLQALPPGESSWGGYLYYGSALKFYADFENVAMGLWGLHLAGKSGGAFDWTFRAAGGDIRALAVELLLASGSVKVGVLRPDGRVVPVADHAGRIEIPAELLGTPQVTLRIEGYNPGENESCWIHTARATVTVE